MYTLYFLLSGKDDSLNRGDLGMTAAVVLRLVEPICGLGHHMYMDNLYTSPALFRELRFRGLEICCTLQLRLNRRGIPLEAKGKLEKGGKKRLKCFGSLFNYS